MRFLKIDEVAAKWEISPRAVQILCKEGKIDGAQRFGRAWMIPENAIRPIDRRTREGRILSDENQPLPRKTPFLYMTDLYNAPGTADALIKIIIRAPTIYVIAIKGTNFSVTEAIRLIPPTITRPANNITKSAVIHFGIPKELSRPFAISFP